MARSSAKGVRMAAGREHPRSLACEGERYGTAQTARSSENERGRPLKGPTAPTAVVRFTGCATIVRSIVSQPADGRWMNDERWEEVLRRLDKQFGRPRVRRSRGRGNHAVVESVIWRSPMGRMKLARTTRPLVVDKKLHYSNRSGGGSYVEYVYSDTETTSRSASTAGPMQSTTGKKSTRARSAKPEPLTTHDGPESRVGLGPRHRSGCARVRPLDGARR